MNLRRLLSLIILASFLTLGSSCSYIQNNRCFLAETRYMAMRDVFEGTGSYQRTIQEMNEAGWARCEINQFRYRLRKELGLDSDQYDNLFLLTDPDPKNLDDYPGVVK